MTEVDGSRRERWREEGKESAPVTNQARRGWAWQPWCAVAVAHVVLTGILAALQPVDLGGGTGKFAPPDESAHVAYLRELTSTWRLPVFRSGKGNYEAHQPPVYYLVASPVYLLGRLGGERSAVVAVRALSVLIGAVSVLLIWRLAALAFGGQTAAATAATCVGALWPARVIACSSVSNDALAELAGLGALVAMCALLDKVSVRGALVAGLGVGLAMLVKSSTLPLVVVGLVAVCVGAQRAGWSAKQCAMGMVVFLSGVLILWGPWGARNTLLYGDPLAARAFAEVFRQDRATPEFFLQRGLTGAQYYELVVLNTALSFWGVFGQANLWLPAWYYVLAGAWWAAGFGLVLAKAIARPQSESARAVWGVLVLHLVLTAALFLRFNAVFYQAQARYFLPASAGIGLVMAWPWVWPRRLRLTAVGLVVFLMLAVAAVGMYAAGAARPDVPFA